MVQCSMNGGGVVDCAIVTGSPSASVVLETPPPQLPLLRHGVQGPKLWRRPGPFSKVR